MSPCIATLDGGGLCGRPARHMDSMRNGLVCDGHNPRGEPWVMRNWLRPFAEHIKRPFDLSVEELVNGQNSLGVQIHWQEVEKVMEDVRLLYRLRDAGLLQGVAAPPSRPAGAPMEASPHQPPPPRPGVETPGAPAPIPFHAD